MHSTVKPDSAFFSLVEALPVGIVVHRDRSILYANRVCLAVLGVERSEELFGRDPVDLFPPEDRERHARRIAALARGEAVAPAQSRLMTADGRTHVVEALGFRLELGDGPALVSVVRDVTVEREAQVALAESEARKKAILGASLEAIVTMDDDGLIAGFNPAAEKTFGYRRADVLGKPVAELLVPPAHRDAHRKGLARQFETGEGSILGRRVELSALRADGSEFPVELSVVRLDRDPPLFTAFIRDLTERRKLEQAQAGAAALQEENRRIHEGSRLKSEFLANMSHELRTPLNAVIGFADLLFDGVLGPVSPGQRDALNDVLRSGRHLLRLINDVLDLAKVEAGRIELKPEPVDLRAVIGEVGGILAPLAARKAIRIETDLDPLAPEAVVDPARLRQVLYNYLSNAVKFTASGGRVTVRTRAEGTGGFRLEVEDTGIGIRPEDIGRLFLEFQQLDAGLARKYEGTGMGLALTRRLLEAQGGAVGVRSEFGKGSTFSAVFPGRR